MELKVNFYATLRQIVGTKTVAFTLPEQGTVRQLLDEITGRFPALQPELFDEQGNLYGHVHIFINGRDVPFLENQLDTRLLPADSVNIFPAVGGG